MKMNEGHRFALRVAIQIMEDHGRNGHYGDPMAVEKWLERLFEIMEQAQKDSTNVGFKGISDGIVNSKKMIVNAFKNPWDHKAKGD